MSKSQLLLLHGALGSKDQLENLRSILSENFECHSIDFEGHGGLESNAEYSIDRFTENVKDYLDNNNIESSDIFGYSMGGYVALNLALKYPNKVKRIMTLGTKFNWTEESAAKEVKMLNPEKIEEKVPKFAQRLQEIHFANDWKSVLNKTASMMQGLGSGKKLNNVDLAKISNTVLIGIGSEDNMVSIDESKEASANLPNGDFKIFEGFQHPIEKVNPQSLSELIKANFSS